MTEVVLKRFKSPDEIRTFEKGKFEIVHLGGMTMVAPRTNGVALVPTRRQVARTERMPCRARGHGHFRARNCGDEQWRRD